jgi:hypothetical protein
MMKRIIIFLLISLFLASTVYAESPKFQSFIEHFPKGKIDWEKGYFYGEGIGYPHQNDSSKAKALKVAQAEALSAILQVASKLRVDDQNTLADLEKEKAIIRIKALVHYEPFKREFISEKGHPFFRVTYRAPLTGIKGLTKQLLTHLRSKPPPWQDFPKPGHPELDDDSLPWLILDARGLEPQVQVQPAIFPKVVSESGETVYQVSQVEEDALVERGMARYVVSDESQEELTTGSIRRPLAWLLKLIFPDSVYAQEKEKRKKRGLYVVKDVKRAEGLMKTNLVISEGDALSIKAEDASSQVLKKCRVIVVVSSAVGGVEGRLMEYLALNE